MAELFAIPSPGAPLHFGSPGAPAVIVVHDEYGRLPWLIPFAEALAGRGSFRVVVPDLYDGVATDDEHEALSMSSRLADRPSRDTLLAELLVARADGSPRAGIVGFSGGGALALRIAEAGAVDAVVAYDATLEASQQGIIPCPLLLHVAEQGVWPETGNPEQFISRLRENGTPVTRHSYAGAEHGFANASIPALTDTRAAALAFARTTVFLETHLAD